jgi:tetratricopeptide (TPR) repeat protein
MKAGASGPGLYDGLNRHHRAINTDSPEAQLWFDQGLVLAYGFNHDEAIRSFEAAARHDPESPMPWWGIAYAHGMNINDPVMTDDRWRIAWEAAQEARQRIDSGAPAEAALVRAVSARYSWPPPGEQRTLDQAYADAMERAWRQNPKDPDIGALYAESLMDLQPWDYWTNGGDPKGRIAEVVSTLESVLEIDPDHPGATHFYIHALEASKHPDRAIAAAERLRDRVPGAGHLVHMPSHIYVRVGRYADAADANTRAVAADRAYFAVAPEPDIYSIYYAHNLHFLAYASMMEGRFETAIKAARDLEREIPERVLRKYGSLIEGIMPTTFHVLIRFGRWQEILEEPEPPDYRLVSRAVRHYARGIALSALGRTAEVQAEIDAFEEAMARVPGDWWIFNNKVDQVLPIARAMLEGELAFREGRREDAFKALRRGIAAEDALVYDEPPGWMLPVRHPLGAFLMSSGRYAEAEAVYREDQRRNRNNGWSLLGLRQALEAQGRSAEAVSIVPQLAAAWPRTDVKATSSCLCEPRPRWVVRPNP